MRSTLVPPFSMWLRKSRASQQCKRAIATPRQQRHGVSRRAGSNFSDLRSLNFFWRSVIFFFVDAPFVLLGANRVSCSTVVCCATRVAPICSATQKLALPAPHATPRRCKTAFFDLLSKTSNSWAFSLLLFKVYWCRQQLLGCFAFSEERKYCGGCSEEKTRHTHNKTNIPKTREPSRASRNCLPEKLTTQTNASASEISFFDVLEVARRNKQPSPVLVRLTFNRHTSTHLPTPQKCH